MGKGRGGARKIGRNKIKGNRYLTARKRIKNKTKKLEKYIDKHTKEESKENIIKSCRIGRIREGFSKEPFKCKSRSVHPQSDQNAG